MNLIDSSDLVFNNDKDNGIMSGGFSVNSILMKNRSSPIVTLNSNNEQMGGKNVSDIFNDLVVPNWALYHPNFFLKNSILTHEENDHDSDSDKDDVLDDNLHESLLEIITQQENHKAFRKKHTKRDKLTNAHKKTKKTKKIKKLKE